MWTYNKVLEYPIKIKNRNWFSSTFSKFKKGVQNYNNYNLKFKI